MKKGRNTKHQHYSKNYGQIEDAEGGRNSLPWGKAYQLGIQYQMVDSENTHTRNIIQNETVMFRNIYFYIYACNNQ